MELAESDRSTSYEMSRRDIQIEEDKDSVTVEPKRREVDHGSTHEESDLDKLNEIPLDETCRRPSSLPTAAPLLSEPDSGSERVASATTDQAEITTEHHPPASSILATVDQASERVRKGGSIFAPNDSHSLKGEVPSEYCYSPLSGQGSIRLLRLMPHQDKSAPIQCQIFEYTLQNEGTHLYEALSYVWGSEDNRQPIYIQPGDKSSNRLCPPAGNNLRLLVTANLHLALLHLRDRVIERIIWVDAICINQEDIGEKGQQVQSMTKIYAKASRVIVWLGVATKDDQQALVHIRQAAEKQQAISLRLNEPSPPSMAGETEKTILTLLQRPWFQRIWVLQEVAAARHVLIKCGPTEIDGYAFCSGLSALRLSYKTCPDLQGVIRSVSYLINGAIFRPRYEGDEAGRSGRFSLDICPLGELMDRYHTREATKRHDKIYALLGMSSDDPSTAGLVPNYESSWSEVFQKLVNFSLSDQVYVYTRENNEVAIINGKGCILGEVSSVERDVTRDDRQRVKIGPKTKFGMRREHDFSFTLPASAKPIRQRDVVCLLEGALNPTIIRPRNGYSAVLMIAAPLADSLETTTPQWPDLIQSTITFPNDLLLVWDWNVSRSKSQDGENYEYLMNNRGVLKCPRAECQNDLDKALRLWNMGLLLNELERYEEARKNIQKVVEVYGAMLGRGDKTYPDHQPLRKADGEVLRVVEDLLIEDKVDYAPLSIAARISDEAIVRQLLATGRVDQDCQDKDGRTPLSWAAENGHEAIMRLLLDNDASVNKADKELWTPLFWAVEKGHEAVVKLLLDHHARVDAMASESKTPLYLAANKGHEAIVRLLLDKGADVNPGNWSQKTPLFLAVTEGHEGIVKLLLDKGAGLVLRRTSTSILISAIQGRHEGIARLLLDEGVDVNASADLKFFRPLICASSEGQETFVRLLLEKGARVDASDLSKRTALFYAAQNGHEAVVRLLLDKGATVNLADIYHYTPLYLAAWGGHETIVRLLLDKGALVNEKDKYGQTPLSMASTNKHWDVAQLLRDRGAAEV